MHLFSSLLVFLAAGCVDKTSPDSGDTAPQSVDADGDGVLAVDDCDDGDPTVYPGAVELCNGIDDDCDGLPDEDAADASTWYTDSDSDGYGDPALPLSACDAPSGAVADGTDCDDTLAAVHPDAELACGSATLDADCDGVSDWDLVVPTDYATIAEAIDAADEDDDICVLAGTYTENITVQQAVNLVGEGPDTTFIDGGGLSFVLLYNTVLGDNRISGFTLQNGYYYGGAGLYLYASDLVADNLIIRDNDCATGSSTVCDGAGMWMRAAATLTLSNSSIVSNSGGSSYVNGGAVAITDSSATFTNVEIRDNSFFASKTSGGIGVLVYGGDFYAENLIIAGNDISLTAASADYQGVVTARNGATIELVNATIVENTASMLGGSLNGAGVYSTNDADVITLTNVTVSGSSVSGAGSELGGGVGRAGSGAVTVSYSNFYDNSGTDWYNMTDLTGLDGNLSVTPGFTDISASDPNDWDLRLGSGSALLDAGDPNILDADGSTSDIGAYGGPGGAGW